MRIKKTLMLVLSLLMVMMLLSACRASSERYELTSFIGRSEASFAKKSGLKLVEQSNGVYQEENVAQVMLTGKDVTSVTLLKNAGEYSVYGVKIGMAKADVDMLLSSTFGTEISKTIDSNNNAITYSYLKDKNELYISYDVDSETVNGLSYYKVEQSKQEAVDNGSANSGELMAMIGDTRVYYNEAMIYLMLAKKNYVNDYGNGIWNADIHGNGQNFGSMIKNEVMNQITELKIIRAEAGKLGITLAEDEVAEANSYAKEQYDSLSPEVITKYMITEELLQQVYSDNLLASKVFESKTINVNTDVPDEQAKQITVQDILIYSTEVDVQGKRVPLSDEDKQVAYQKVLNLAEQAKTAKDFYSLAEANTQADDIEYTFGKGQAPKDFSSAFEQTAFGLKTGEISNIISTNYGWHIIYCVSDFNEDATIQVKEKIIEERRTKMFADVKHLFLLSFSTFIPISIGVAVCFSANCVVCCQAAHMPEQEKHAAIPILIVHKLDLLEQLKIL